MAERTARYIELFGPHPARAGESYHWDRQNGYAHQEYGLIWQRDVEDVYFGLEPSGCWVTKFLISQAENGFWYAYEACYNGSREMRFKAKNGAQDSPIASGRRVAEVMRAVELWSVDRYGTNKHIGLAPRC